MKISWNQYMVSLPKQTVSDELTWMRNLNSEEYFRVKEFSRWMFCPVKQVLNQTLSRQMPDILQAWTLQYTTGLRLNSNNLKILKASSNQRKNCCFVMEITIYLKCDIRSYKDKEMFCWQIVHRLKLVSKILDYLPSLEEMNNTFR